MYKSLLLLIKQNNCIAAFTIIENVPFFFHFISRHISLKIYSKILNLTFCSQ